MDVYHIIEPKGARIPILVSVPHSGTFFPEDVLEKMNPEKARFPEDTDWFVNRLYSFCSEMGITMIVANYNRWVVDLNRNPQNAPLYKDGRVITNVVSVTDFNGETIYKEEYQPNDKEIQKRLERYFYPYHEKVEEILLNFRNEFGTALLFDVHSIKKNVPGIQNDDFPQFILGDNDEKSAHRELIQIAIEKLSNKGFDFSHNHPFKGGFITRSFGNPQENIHALQLEMIKTNYMDDSEEHYDEVRAGKVQEVLKETLFNLYQKLIKLKI